MCWVWCLRRGGEEGEEEWLSLDVHYKIKDLAVFVGVVILVVIFRGLDFGCGHRRGMINTTSTITRFETEGVGGIRGNVRRVPGQLF